MRRFVRIGIYCALAAGLILSGLAMPSRVTAGTNGQSLETPLPPTSVSVYPFTVPGPDANSLVIERKMTPDQLVAGGTAQVTVTLNGRGGACFGVPLKPIDAMLVVDTSTSAGVGPGSNWELTVGITKALFANLAQTVYLDPATVAGMSQVGIVSSTTGTFGPEPNLLLPLTSDYRLLSAKIDGLLPSGDTAIADGLRLAAGELPKAAASKRARVIVLMLHDNVVLSTATRAALEEVTQQDIAVYLVANSLNLQEEDKITSSNMDGLAIKKYYLDPAPSDLRKLYVLAAEGSLDLAAGAIQITEQVTPSGQASFSNVSNGGVVQGSQVTWNLPGLATSDQFEVGYDLNIFPSASNTMQIASDVKWIDCNGYPQARELTRMNGAVQTPTSSGSDAPITPGINPTLNSGVTMPPPSTFTPQPNDKDRGIVIFWWVCLPLLLLPLMVYLFYRYFFKPPLPPKKAVGKPNIRPFEPQKTIVEPPKQDPINGTDATHDIISKSVVDKQGKYLKLRGRDIGETFDAGRPAQIKVWLDEADKDIFQVIANLVLEKKRDDLTGAVEQRKIGVLQISEKDMDGRRGLLSLTFREIKVQAMLLGIQELRAENVPAELQQQLKELGFSESDEKFTMKI